VGTKTAKAEPAISRYVSDFIEMAINLFGHVQRWQTRGYYIVWGFPAAGAGVGSGDRPVLVLRGNSAF
jgi:hypothetical protein